MLGSTGNVWGVLGACPGLGLGSIGNVRGMGSVRPEGKMAKM